MAGIAFTLTGQELRAIQNENQISEIRFRVTPSLKKYIEASLDELGVKGVSDFARGALLNAIELAKLSRDPKWRKFIATVSEGPAKAILGHGLTLPDASDIEGRGRGRKGVSIEELKRKLAERHNKKTSI
ncbi:MAG TPA: hypothetical protein VK914_02535 [bacterium]|nr:hypothetical protein [bacterium]